MAKPYKEGGIWRLSIREADGRWRYPRTKAKTKAEAQTLQREAENKVERQRLGLEPLATGSDFKTFGDMIDWYWNGYGFKLKSTTTKGLIDKHLRKPLGHLPVRDITTDRIEELLISRERSKELGPKSVNTMRGVIHRIFNVAIKRRRWLGMNPAVAVERRKVPKREPSYLDEAEVQALLAALDPRWRPMFAAAVYTGMRKGELIGLRKDSVDLVERRLRVANSYDSETTKGGREDSLPIVEELVPYLKAAFASAPESEFVFPREDGKMHVRDLQLPDILRRALGRAGIVTGWVHKCRRRGCGYQVKATTQDAGKCPRCGMRLWVKAVPRRVRFHDLRHTTATLLLKGGVPLATVQRILRHTDPRLTTGTYGHLNIDDMRDGLSKLKFGDGERTLAEIAPPPEFPGAAEGAVPEQTGEARAEGAVKGMTPAMPVPQESLLSIKEVAKRLGVCKASAYRLCERGELRHVRVSGAVRVEPKELECYLRSCSSGLGVAPDTSSSQVAAAGLR